MQIQQLRLHARDVEQQGAFFTERFGLAPLYGTEQELSFQIGHTVLTFERNADWTGLYHYAFQIPEHQFDEAVTWLRQRCPLLEDAEKRQEFHFEAWNAHAVYFADGENNIAELIARHSLKSTAPAVFSGSSLEGVSEIGYVVDDVQGTVARLGRDYAISPYLAQSHEEFTAVGDTDGLLIVVKRSRPWLPTGWPATPGWFSATVQTANGRQVLEPGEENA